MEEPQFTPLRTDAKALAINALYIELIAAKNQLEELAHAVNMRWDSLPSTEQAIAGENLLIGLARWRSATLSFAHHSEQLGLDLHSLLLGPLLPTIDLLIGSTLELHFQGRNPARYLDPPPSRINGPLFQIRETLALSQILPKATSRRAG